MFVSGDSCAECHREHLGKDLKLVELEDRTCTRCHENIQAKSVVENSPKPIANVASFSARSTQPHPDFRSLGNYVGTIKFSHAQHLSPGQAWSSQDSIVKRFENIDAGYREQYANGRPFTDAQLKDPIQLQCADCHEPDGIADSESLASLVTAYGNGELIRSSNSKLTNRFLYYSPIRFEKHCIACHDLDNVPHGLDRKQTEAAVAKVTPVRTLEILKKLNSPSNNGASEGIDKKQAIDIETRLTSLMTNTGACSKCHTLALKDAAGIEPADIVSKSSIRDRWFQSASFSHGAHVMVECITCHKEPYEKPSPQSTDTTQIAVAGIEPRKAMIEGIETCRTCHISEPDQRAKEFEKGQRNVATADCVDCHRFHVDEPKRNVSMPVASKFSESDLVREFLTQGTQF